MLPNRWNIFRTLLVHFILIHKSDSEIRYFAVLFHTGQSINELENGPSSYRQKGIYFALVLIKR